MNAQEAAEQLRLVAEAGGHFVIVHLPNGQRHEVYSIELRGSDAVLNVGRGLLPEPEDRK